LLLSVPGSAWAQESEELARFAVELAAFPTFTERQVEGPDRDDKLVSDHRLGLVLTGTYRATDWLQVGLYLHTDLGSTSRTLFVSSDESEEELETVIEGSYWELWTAVFARLTWRAAFFELGWAPLMLRNDTTRTDLPNESGDTDGVFVGSRSVAFLAGLGAMIPIAEKLSVTVRLQLRIRYMVERGGEPIDGEEEFGQMTAWPFVGLAYSF